MRDFLTVYDQQLNPLGPLDFASDVGYTLKHNELATASLALPSDDPANALCQPYNFIRLPEPSRDIGLFRFVTMPSDDPLRLAGKAAYSLEHVMATLLDDPLFGYHEIGGTGIYTEDVMRYILSFQEVKRWQLGVCEFRDQFAYKFENTSLLTALLSIGQLLVEDFTWEFDTSSYPWTVHLRRADSATGCGIHYMRNLAGIEKSWDASTLVTRLFLLGYGEGVNQLNIRRINSGKPYIDAETVAKWGVKCGIFTDTRIEDEATLLARGRALLKHVQDPYYSYTASALDLSALTGHAWDRFMPGKLVRVEDSEHQVNFDARIVSISKGDLLNKPSEIDITIANAERDAAESLNTLANRMAIYELYSQGSTSLDTVHFADNADAGHPMVIRQHIFDDCVRVNKMMLTWSLTAFRAYETGAAAGGGQTSTSESGGGSTQTSKANASASSTSDASSKSTAGITNALSLGALPSATSNASPMTGTYEPNGATFSTHYHSVNPHGHTFVHQHRIDHEHDISHTHTVRVPSHTHDVTIPAHVHTFTMPTHTHAIMYGIYEGGRASSVSILVDGNQVPAASLKANGTDIVPWLAKDADGKITRGTNHIIQIVPNALTRIEGSMTTKQFVQSVGGGDY